MGITRLGKGIVRLPLLAALLAGCAAQQAVNIEKPVWPDPPEKPRIQFVTGLRGKEDFGREKTFGEKFREAAFGDSDIAYVYQPTGLATSADGKRLYVADWVRGYIIVFDFEKGRTSVMGGPGSKKPLASPLSVALDAAENVYAVDRNLMLVRVFDKAGNHLRDITTLGTEPFERPTGIAVDPKRNLVYVADSSHVNSVNHRIFVFTTDGKFVRHIGKRGNVDGAFNIPTFLYVDGEGRLYVCDSLNFRIQIFDHEGKFLAKFGQQGDAPGYFSKIKGVAKDSFGNIYVVDGGASAVTIFNAKFQPLLFFGGLSADPGYFQGPTAIAIDKDNKIYVADSLSARINVYQLVNTTAEDSLAAEEPKKGPPERR